VVPRDIDAVVMFIETMSLASAGSQLVHCGEVSSPRDEGALRRLDRVVRRGTELSLQYSHANDESRLSRVSTGRLVHSAILVASHYRLYAWIAITTGGNRAYQPLTQGRERSSAT
jgi:hypothetical protein